MYRVVGVALLLPANKIRFESHDIKLSVPFLTKLWARSQQQLKHLTRAETVDNESKWQTDHTYQQQSQITERQSSATTPSVSFWCHHPSPPTPLFASPKLTPHPQSLPIPLNSDTMYIKGVMGGIHEEQHLTTIVFVNVQTAQAPRQRSIDHIRSMPLFLLWFKSRIRHTHLVGDIKCSNKEIFD